MKVWVVAIGTSGNQRFIFASNKRRENVGASHLITRVEERWLDEALRVVTGSVEREGRITESSVEIVTANAGGITALVKDPDAGRELITHVTHQALREAPGLDVCGAIGDELEWDEIDAAGLAQAIRRARDLLPVARMRRAGPRLRFPGVPIVARCTSSGLPAARVVQWVSRERPEPRSAPSLAKLDAFPAALDRLAIKMGLCDDGKDALRPARKRLARVVDWLNDRAEWVAVVHADGNGMGGVFQNFPAIMEKLGRTTPEEYVACLRAFSEGVDECASEALREVLAAVKEKGSFRMIAGEPALLPLVLGGDDLTVVCDGSIALWFAERYQKEFTQRAWDNDDVGGLLRDADQRGLGACAGVAIVKRHYPFHSAVGLAEELTKDAKAVKGALGQDHCALSFHVLYESAVANLSRLREETTLPGDTLLTAQPYVVGDILRDSQGWSCHRHWEDLLRRVNALTRTDGDDRRPLSGAQTHDLRGGLFHGREVADARYRLLVGRIGSAAEELAGEGDSLFWTVENGPQLTGLLDAMNAAGFLPRPTDAELEQTA